MMVLTTFDTRAFIQELEDSGISEDHAKAICSAFNKVIQSDSIATKLDLEDSKVSIIK